MTQNIGKTIHILILKHRLLAFIVITFCFSWFFWIPQALLAQGVYLPELIIKFLNSPFNIAAFGPLVGAIVLVYFENGFKGIKILLKKGIQTNFSKKWLFPVLFLIPLISFASVLLAGLLNNEQINFSLLANPINFIYWFIFIMLLGGPVQEEFGWRGYALDQLLKKRSALSASLILGLVWAIWHMPLNFSNLPAGPQYSQALSMIIGGIITISILSILFTWIYLNTKGSVLTAILFHASLNFSTFKLFPVFESQYSIQYYTFIILITAVIVVLIYGKNLILKKNHY